MGDYILSICDVEGNEIHRQTFFDVEYTFMNEHGNKLISFFAVDRFKILNWNTQEEE